MNEKQPTRNLVLGVFVTFGFLLVGCYFLVFHLGRDLHFWLQTRNGMEVPVTKIMELAQKENDEGITGEISVRYLYEVDGRKFVGTFASIHRDGDNFDPFLSDLYNKLSAAKEGRQQISCFVNSADPSISVIDNTLRPARVAVESLFSIGWIVFMAYPLFSCICSLWERRKSSLVLGKKAANNSFERESQTLQ